MKQYISILNYILGGFFNICFALVVMLLIYTASLRGLEYGKQLVDEEVSTKPSKEVVIEIPEDATTEKIGEILEQNGLISNKYVFWLQSRLNGTYKLFKSGEHRLDMSMSSNDIMELLQQTTNYLTITVVEGMTLRQIGKLAESKGWFTEQEFVDACNNFVDSDKSYSFLENIPDRENKLEGYLFPDTYYLPENPVPDHLIIRMLNRFEEVIKSFEPQIEETDYTMDDIVIMASIIEREIVRSEERHLASSVIHNRMNLNMRLQMCSTIMYALDKRKDRLLDSDLEIESPYNTYLLYGLPVGPISNPGRASIEAALNPGDTDYLYFVIKDEETGEHLFTNDYEEFLEAKVLYNQRF